MRGLIEILGRLLAAVLGAFGTVALASRLLRRAGKPLRVAPPEPPEGDEQQQEEPPAPGWVRLPPPDLPQPTYWPVIVGLGITFIAWGIASSLFVSAIGLVLFASGLAGWIGENLHGSASD